MRRESEPGSKRKEWLGCHAHVRRAAGVQEWVREGPAIDSGRRKNLSIYINCQPVISGSILGNRTFALDCNGRTNTRIGRKGARPTSEFAEQDIDPKT
jgi:hypothetical protein